MGDQAILEPLAQREYAHVMMHRYICLRPILAKIIVSVMLLYAVGPAAAEQSSFPGGFRLGSSLEDARRHAASRGWQLLAISPELPGQWLVEDQNISIHVCNDTLARITQSSPGDLDEFAQIVSLIRRERGEPKLQVVTFIAGSVPVSNIDARFAEMDGLSVAVQLSSTGGKLALATSYFSHACAGHSTEP